MFSPHWEPSASQPEPLPPTSFYLWSLQIKRQKLFELIWSLDFLISFTVSVNQINSSPKSPLLGSPVEVTHLDPTRVREGLGSLGQVLHRHKIHNNGLQLKKAYIFRGTVRRPVFTERIPLSLTPLKFGTAGGLNWNFICWRASCSWWVGTMLAEASRSPPLKFIL